MGRERSRTRQYLYFCAAGLIMAMLAACASVGSRLADQENAHLRQGRHLLAQGDFTGALRENLQVLARFPRTPPGDAALFNIGMIHVALCQPATGHRAGPDFLCPAPGGFSRESARRRGQDLGQHSRVPGKNRTKTHRVRRKEARIADETGRRPPAARTAAPRSR